DGPDMWIDGDTAIENRRSAFPVANFADQFHLDVDRIDVAVCPALCGSLDPVNEADRTDVAEIDGDHAADGPQAAHRLVAFDGVGGERCTGTVTLDHAAKDARVWLSAVAALLAGRL